VALKQRERILAWGAGTVLSLAIVQFGYNSLEGLFEERQTQKEALERDIADKEAAQLRGARARKKLAAWQQRSLPTDLVLARSLYKNWLARLLERTRLAKASVTLGAEVPKPGIYTRMSVNVRGQGTMEQVVQLLFDFYQADQLHSIRQMTLTPLAKSDVATEAPGRPSTPGAGATAAAPGGGPGGGSGGGGFGNRGGFGRPGFGGGNFGPGGGGAGGPGGGGFGPGGGFGGGAFAGGGRGGARGEGQKYEVMLSIEALALPGATHADQLNDGKSDRLAFGDIDTYRKTITERNFFSPYTPVVENDPAADTFVTAVVKKHGKYQVWVNLRSSGKTLKLGEGETFELGKETATIERIERDKIAIEAGGRRREIGLGKSFAEERGRRGGGRGRRGFPGTSISPPSIE
jgi:hypothetical protein